MTGHRFHPSRRMLNWVGYAVMVLCFVFIGIKIVQMKPDFSRVVHPVACLLLSLALALGSAGVVYFSAAAWKSVLQFIHGKKLPYREIAGVYVKSNIAKYLPGNVMHFAGRNLLAGRLGFSQLDIAFATVTEVGVLVVTACLWWAVLAFKPFVSFLGTAVSSMRAHPLYLILGVALLALLTAVIVFYLRRKGILSKYKKFFTRQFAVLLLRLFGMYSLTLLLPGIFMMLLFLIPFGLPFTSQTVLLTVAAYAASWVAGYIVIGVPGGIGVRESILLLILAPLYRSDIILIVAILSRIVSIAGDAAAFFTAPLLLGRQQTPAEQSAGPSETAK